MSSSNDDSDSEYLLVQSCLLINAQRLHLRVSCLKLPSSWGVSYLHVGLLLSMFLI